MDILRVDLTNLNKLFWNPKGLGLQFVKPAFWNTPLVSVCKMFLCVCVCMQVQATDADQGDNGRVLYRILSGECDFFFPVSHALVMGLSHTLC